MSRLARLTAGLTGLSELGELWRLIHARLAFLPLTLRFGLALTGLTLLLALRLTLSLALLAAALLSDLLPLSLALAAGLLAAGLLALALPARLWSTVDGHAGLLTLPLTLPTGLTEGSELSELLATVAIHLASLVTALACAVGVLTTVALAVRVTLVAGSVTAADDHALAATVAVARGSRTGIVGVVDDIDDAATQGRGFHDQVIA